MLTDRQTVRHGTRTNYIVLGSIKSLLVNFAVWALFKTMEQGFAGLNE